MIGYGNSFGLLLLTSSSFIKPVRDAFGWSTQQAAILPITSLTMAFLFPFAGRLIDRWGARPFAIGGLAGIAGCYLALASCPANVALYRALAVMIGVCGAACGPMTFSRGVGSWFVANRGAALGLLISGLSIGGFLGIPFASFLIGRFGWRVGYVGLAASILVIGLPAVAGFFRERPAACPLAIASAGASAAVDGMSLAEAFRDLRFWMLLAAFTFSALPIGVLSSHLMPILTARGFSAAQAVSLGTLFAVSIGISRIGIGALLDRLRDHLVAAACLVSAGVGAFVLFHAGGSHALLEVQGTMVLIGLAYGAEGDLAGYFTLKLFGLRAFAAITGCFSSAIAIGTALGGFVGSAVVDRAGTYDPLAPFMAASLVVAGTLMFAQHHLRRPAAPRDEQRGASSDRRQGAGASVTSSSGDLGARPAPHMKEGG